VISDVRFPCRVIINRVNRKIKEKETIRIIFRVVVFLGASLIFVSPSYKKKKHRNRLGALDLVVHEDTSRPSKEKKSDEKICSPCETGVFVMRDNNDFDPSTVYGSTVFNRFQPFSTVFNRFQPFSTVFIRFHSGTK
jgi:hypothetical protein